MAGCFQQRSRAAAISANGTAAVEAGHCQCRSHRFCLSKYISRLSFDHVASWLNKCMAGFAYLQVLDSIAIKQATRDNAAYIDASHMQCIQSSPQEHG